MTLVNERSYKTLTCAMTPDGIHPPCWFSCNGGLYLAVKWQRDFNGEETLDAVSFCEYAEPKASTWRRTDDSKVDVVFDSSVTIIYETVRLQQ